MHARFPIGVLVLVSGVANVAAEEGNALVVYQTHDMALSLDARGWVVGIRDRVNDRECMTAGRSCPLLTLTVDGKEYTSTSAEPQANGAELVLSYDLPGVRAVVECATLPTHMRFRLASLQGASPSEIRWGPFFTTIGKTVGEIIAVVRDDVFAFGLQGLNMQTIGAASGFEGGSMLTAYAREHDGGVVGSAIALFGAPEGDALSRIGDIEVAEGLPHPMLDGVWGKVSPTAKLSYLITPFGESSIEAVLDRAERAGLRYVYHPGPFLTWGHFALNPAEFPDGDESMKRCVEAAEKRGIRLGVHTLTAFITTNDPYVTPVPDPRLARMGSSALVAAVDASATEIPIVDAGPFRERGTLGAAIIEKEIVQYDGISDGAPLRLMGCRRGAFGTTASAYDTGTDIGKLADHAYRTFYPGIDNGMMDEMTARLVELFNATGLRQISFDGLEGLSTYGYGEYARNRFVQQCFDGWKPEVVNDASNLLHYLWHIHTRMNWGEPWGKAMREGMPDYRFANQELFDRNLFPRMLGWFQLRLASGDVEATDLSGMEWVLSKATGFDAGFAIATSLGEMQQNGRTDAMLAAVREWEAARLSGAFSDDQRRRLREPSSEWHLTPGRDGTWLLQPIQFASFTFPTDAIQPGQPAVSTWQVENPFGAQPLVFTLRVSPEAVGGVLEDPTISVGLREVTIRTRVEPGQYLVYDGTAALQRCDADWNVLEVIDMGQEMPRIGGGAQNVRFTCQSLAAAPAATRVTFRFAGATEPVHGTR